MAFPTISEAQALAEAMSGIYPTSQILLGQITGEDYIRNLALHFYEELVCDYRLEPNCLNAVMALGYYEFHKQKAPHKPVPIQLVLPIFPAPPGLNPVYDDKITIFVWPDGSWVRKSEYNEVEYSFKGDDYAVMYLPMELNESSIDIMAHEFADDPSIKWRVEMYPFITKG